MDGLSRRLRETLVSYHSLNETEWNIAKKSKDVTVWRKPSEEFGGFLYKAEGTVPDNPRRIIEFMIPGPRRMEWDSLMTSLEIVETLDERQIPYPDPNNPTQWPDIYLYLIESPGKPGCCVVKYSTAGQLWNIISPREFVDFSYTCDYQRGLLSCGVSVEHSEQTPGLVRGFNHPCGWFCVPTEDPAVSLLTGFIQTDLRGMIPQSAVDSAMAAGLVRFYRELTHALAAQPP